VALLAGAAQAGVPAPESPVLLSEFIDANAPYPQAHASTIVQLPDGTVAAAWFGGSGEGNADVRIWFARREAGGWEKPEPVADGITPEGKRYPTWNPVLFQPPGGPLTLFYKVGPNPRDWWGMVKTSTDGGHHWSPAQRLPDGVLGPIKNKPVVLKNGTWLLPSSREVGTPEHNRWFIQMEYSADKGRTWHAETPIESPVGLEAIQPSVLTLSDGKLALIARTRQGVLAMSRSSDQGQTWSPLVAADLPNPNSGADAITLADGRQLVIYNHAGHWPDRPGDGPRYPLNVGLSDDGVHWHNAFTLESKPLPDGYAYPAVIQTRDGLVHVTYTFDRKKIRHVVLQPRDLK
jgi:predicted neuraminidase